MDRAERRRRRDLAAAGAPAASSSSGSAGRTRVAVIRHDRLSVCRERRAGARTTDREQRLVAPGDGVDQRTERQPDIPSPRGARMAYTLPDDVDRRPVTIDGAGTLGRRIAAVYAAGGSDVRTSTPSARASRGGQDLRRAEHRRDATGAGDPRGPHGGGRDRPTTSSGRCRARGMVVEAVPERLDLKIEVFGDLDRMAEPRRDPGHQLLVAAQPPHDRQGRAPPARAEHPLPAAPRAQRGRAHVVREDRRRGHRGADGQDPALRAQALSRTARERWVHLQPHLGLDQARVPDGGARRAWRGPRTSTRCGGSSRSPASRRFALEPSLSF